LPITIWIGFFGWIVELNLGILLEPLLDQVVFYVWLEHSFLVH